MAESITIQVPGIPAPGGSKKSFRHRYTGKIVTLDDCERNANWRSVVAFKGQVAMAGREPLKGPLSVSVEFLMPRPKGHRGKRGLRPGAPAHHITKPDATKLWRAAEDALKGIAWVDDSQVVDQRVRKRYADEQPGAVITITPVDREAAA